MGLVSAQEFLGRREVVRPTSESGVGEDPGQQKPIIQSRTLGGQGEDFLPRRFPVGRKSQMCCDWNKDSSGNSQFVIS